jgi:hypothetical protein
MRRLWSMINHCSWWILSEFRDVENLFLFSTLLPADPGFTQAASHDKRLESKFQKDFNREQR